MITTEEKIEVVEEYLFRERGVRVKISINLRNEKHELMLLDQAYNHIFNELLRQEKYFRSADEVKFWFRS